MAAASFQPPSHLFERNISLNDLDLALDVREVIRKNVVVPEEATKHRHLGSSTSYSLVLPSFQALDEEFRKFVFSFLVDGHILRELENARRLNWFSSLCRMVTVNTLGDGNCLMHAASIGMWAVNDRYQTLRKTVYEALVEDVEGFYLNRWKSEEQHQILNQVGGYERTEEQWAHEWEEVIRHISQTEFPLGPNGAQFGSLEEIHIFVLANILRRTIIVPSDETLRGQYGDSYAPINFGGIYLPLLWDSVDCIKSPLVIGYADGHFTAVVSIEDGKLDLGIESQSALTSSSCMHAVPLVKYDGTPLPVHFLYDHEVPLASDRLRQYLDCAKVPFAGNPGDPRPPILVAKLHFAEQPRCMKDLVEGYFAKAREEYQRVSRSRQLSPQFQPGTQQPALQIVQCQTQGCDFYGSTETGNRCSKCLNEYLRNLGPAREPSPHVPLRQIPTGQQQNPPNTSTRITASSMHLPLANSVKCRTTGCKYGAVPNRGGLCERCFEAERSAEELKASMNPMNLATAKHCTNQVNGCEFFGLPERHDLCSRCYRTFCLSMENTLGLSSPTGLPPSSPTAAVANHCQTRGCPFPGVPALYGMCVQCYTGCIHSFITSEGRSVGTVTQASPNLPPPPLPPPNVPKKTPLPTGAGKKGVLCASPGCLNEGVFQLGDLCAGCYHRKSGPSPQMRINPVPVPATVAAVTFPVTQPPPSTVSATATVAPTLHLTSALTSAIGHYCSNPTCLNQTEKEGKSLCQRCESWIVSTQYAIPMSSSHQPRRPVGAVTTASSTGASMPPAQMTTVNMGAYTTPVSSSSQQVRTSHEIAATAAFRSPSAEVPAGPCAMGCGKPSAQDSGLCEQCYIAAFELELNRQTVPQPSRQVQGATAASASNNQVEQRNTDIQASSSRSLQQTETSAAAKKPLLPCSSTGCMRFGTLEKNGLCEDCFCKKGNSRSSATASQGNQPQGSSNSNSLYSTRATEQNRQLIGSSLPASRALKEPVQVCQSQSPQYGSGVRRHDSNSGNVEENVQGQRCRGTNCTLFGTPETNGYCFRCFLESTIPQSGPSSIPDFPSEVSSLSIPSDRSLPGHCRVTGCDNFAAPERHGHCENCFKRFYPEVMYRERFAQRQLSELTESNY